MCVCEYLCAHGYIWVYTWARTGMCVCIHMYLSVSVYMHICACARVWIYVWICEGTWACVHTYERVCVSFRSLVAQWVKNLPAMQETWVQSPGHEDPLEKELASHSTLLAWRIPWTEEPGGLQSMESQDSDTT